MSSTIINQQSLIDQINKIKWFHRIPLAEGITTPGVDRTQEKLQTLHLPDLHGKTVLDIGSWDGFFAFEAERRGASRVLATDSFMWKGLGWGSKRGFDLAKQILGSKVEEMIIDPMDLSPERVGSWDVVIYSGIIYHMKHPQTAIERVASVTKELLILETMTDCNFMRRPAIAFYDHGDFGDDTNWCGPNDSAVRFMLRSNGLPNIKRVYKRCLPVRIAHTAYWTFKGHDPLKTLQHGRAAYHARRI